MMKGCCNGMDWKEFQEKFDCEMKETKDGVVVEISAKDPKKAEALKAMIKACKELGCGCC